MTSRMVSRILPASMALVALSAVRACPRIETLLSAFSCILLSFFVKGVMTRRHRFHLMACAVTLSGPAQREKPCLLVHTHVFEQCDT